VGTVGRVSNEYGGGNTSGPWYASEPSTAEIPAYGAPPPRGRGHGHARQGKSRKRLIIAAAVVVVAAIAAVVVVVTRPSTSSGFVPTGSSPAQDAGQITTAFLHAWQDGDLSQAAAYTNHATQAQAQLTTYGNDLHLRKLSGHLQTTTSLSGTQGSATYGISVTVASAASASALHGTWTYHATLTAYQRTNSQAWYIAWTPAVLAPNLTATTHLAAITVAPTVAQVNDADNNDLTSYKDAGLTTIANLMQSKAPPGQGTTGLYVQIETAKGKAVPNSQAAVIAPTNIGNLATTIDATAESAARSAVAMHGNSSMVAIQPSTGKILAIANNAGFNDFALTAQVAPGSTMKIITSTALINAGLVTANSPVACPAAYTVQGITYHNDEGESEPASTPLADDFAQSCNNAFDQWWPHLSGQLAGTASKYYGLNKNWDIGIEGLAASYFHAPPGASGSELAQEAFGEGELVASPLAMASVAATVDSGAFRQPYLLPGTKQVTATPLPASTDAQLKQMMLAVVDTGTAEAIGFGPGVYAKTGTADIQGQEQPNSWLVAFDPSKDVAVAFLVVNAGYGAQYAGPEAKAFLDNY